MNDGGREWVGEAGWGWGEWSMDAAKRSRQPLSFLRVKSEMQCISAMSNIPGIVRFPRNLIEGMRSAC